MIYKLRKDIGAVAISGEQELMEHKVDIFKLHLEQLEKQLPAYQIMAEVKRALLEQEHDNKV